MSWRFADLTGYLSHIYIHLNIPVCTSRSDGYMDVNAVKLLNNVRNWLYLISRWENGVRILFWLVARSQYVKVGIGILPPYKLHEVCTPDSAALRVG